MKHDDRFGPPYLYDTDIVKRWGDKITTKTLANWRSKKKGPPYTVRTGRVMYPLAAVIEYENKHNVVPENK